MKGFLVILFFAVAKAAEMKCPPENTTPPTFFPNPSDCNSYYECDYGKPVLEHCPPGLQWSQSLGRCDWPEVAQCKETETPSPTESTVGPTVDPTAPTTVYPTECPPKDDPNHDILLKNPKDCHSFFKCYKGNKVLVECPAGQEWADHLKRCDWPEVANCKVEQFRL